MVKSPTSLAEACMVWVMAYLFFLIGLASNLSAAHDSINYLLHISHGENLFHQHHLLYHFFAHHWLRLTQLLLPGTSEHYLVEAFTALWGSGVLALCYLFFTNRFGRTRMYAGVSTAVIAFSYGMWFYSINVEVYAPPLFFILLALYRMSAVTAVRNDVLWIAVLHGAAILFHQVNVLFTPVVLYWIYSRTNTSVRNSVATYIGTLALVAGGGYVIVGWISEGHRSLQDFTSWLMGYTVGHDYWQPLSGQTPVKVCAGLARAFIGAQFVFQLPPVKEFILSSFLGHALDDEMFLTRNMPASVAWTLAIVSASIGLGIVALCIRFIKHGRKNSEQQVVRRLLLSTLLIYSLFFTFWMPEIIEFWILQMIIIWLLLLGSVPASSKARNLTVSVPIFFACTLFAVNYAGSIYWLSSFENDWYQVQSSALTVNRSDLVIVKDKWILKDYVRYYHDVEVIATDEALYTTRQIQEKVAKTLSNGGRVYTNAESSPGIFIWRSIQSY